MGISCNEYKFSAAEVEPYCYQKWLCPACCFTRRCGNFVRLIQGGYVFVVCSFYLFIYLSLQVACVSFTLQHTHCSHSHCHGLLLCNGSVLYLFKQVKFSANVRRRCEKICKSVGVPHHWMYRRWDRVCIGVAHGIYKDATAIAKGWAETSLYWHFQWFDIHS